MKLLASLLASLVVALLTAAPAQAELILAVNEGVTYYVTPSEIREKYKDLADLLGKQLKTTVGVVPVDQYPALRKGLDEQQYDLAFVHPAHHSLVSLRDGKYQLVVLTKGYTDYKARFFVENGFSDVGVSASGAVIKQWQEKGGSVLYESKAVPIKHMIASTKMSVMDLEKVRAVMLGLDKSEAGQKILAKVGYKGYESGDPQQLAVLAKWLGY